MSNRIWYRNGFRLEFSEPEIYVNNQARGRSGHMSHAMAEFAPDTLIDFNSNCSAKIMDGHMPYGWIEYRISRDAGVSFGPVRELRCSRDALEDGLFTFSLEKAVACPDGAIVAFLLRNHPGGCEPWLTPMVIRSSDGGETWSEPAEASLYAGRIYASVVWRDSILFMMPCNDASVTFTGTRPEHVYRVFESTDRGFHFREKSVIPWDPVGRGYGAMIVRPDGSLLAYAYNVNAETRMDYALSTDGGETWSETGICELDKKIRNPQISLLDGTYILHGRAGRCGFVFYTSPDGIHWEEGFLFEPEKGGCYYSNSIVLNDPEGGKRLLVQFSQTYERACVNVMHMWIRKIPESAVSGRQEEQNGKR